MDHDAKHVHPDGRARQEHRHIAISSQRLRPTRPSPAAATSHPLVWHPMSSVRAAVGAAGVVGALQVRCPVHVCEKIFLVVLVAHMRSPLLSATDRFAWARESQNAPTVCAELGTQCHTRWCRARDSRRALVDRCGECVQWRCHDLVAADHNFWFRLVGGR